MHRLRYSSHTAIWISGAATVLSIIGLFLASKMHQGAPTTALINLASVVLSVGLIGLIYEIFLRNSVFRETIQVIGLQSEVADAGLSHISIGGNLEPGKLLEDSPYITILLLNPTGWVEHAWNALRTAAATRALSITIFLPDPNSDYLVELAGRLGYGVDTFAATVTSTREYLEHSWKSARTSPPPLKVGSALAIKLLDVPPTYEIVVTSSRAMVNVPQSVHPDISSPNMALAFREGRHGGVAQWLRSQIDGLAALPDEYVDKVTK